MSLRDGTKKMSKSEESDMTRINLTDDADTIAKKIRKARTDPEPLPSEAKGLEGRPEAENLVGIYAALAETDKDQVLREFGNAPFSKFKDSLAELAAARLTPIGNEMRRLMADPVEIDRILDDGARRARQIAEPILGMTKDIVGFIRG
jgi:tryptophanyl-tRNA synthetase